MSGPIGALIGLYITGRGMEEMAKGLDEEEEE